MADEATLAFELRAAETRLYEHFGLSHAEQFVEVAGTSIRVVEIAGDPAHAGGLPPVLLLHGIASVTAAAIPHEELATITVPTLFVWGEDDVFLSPEDARGSLSSIPNSTLVVLPGGHAAWLNEPAAVEEAVREFLGDAVSN